LIDVPPAVVTVTSTVPEPFGEVTWISLADTLLSMWAAAEPKSTAVAPARFEPVMVTTVPPPTGPLFGESFETIGTGDP
jgi:hypothetical protein